MDGSPVFLIASERSGTNLLRRRLSERQSTVVGPPPLHFLKHLFYACPFYGDLNDDSVFHNFVEDSLGLAYHHFSPWDEIIEADEVIEKYPDYFSGKRSAIGVMHTLYSIYAARKGYHSYICKDNNLFDFVCEIASEIPEARFIYLYRDPRDVVLSQKGRPTQNKSTSYLSVLWRDEQIKCIRGWRTLNDSGKIIPLSYEGLIEDEDRQIWRLCYELGLEHSSTNSIDYDFEKTDFAEWKNLSNPTMTSNSKKYLEKLKNKDISRIESIVWHQMNWLGYPPRNRARPKTRKGFVEIESLLGGVSRFIRNKINRSRLTEGQIARAAYTRKLAKNWK